MEIYSKPAKAEISANAEARVGQTRSAFALHSSALVEQYLMLDSVPRCLCRLELSGLHIATQARYVQLEPSGGSVLRIETELDGHRLILRLIGRVRSDCIDELRQRLQSQVSRIVLDLAEVDLIDLESVRFLRDCQDKKIELRNCAPYILEWIWRERIEG